MNKITGAALLSWLGSIVLLAFQAISMIMGKSGNWNNISATDLFGADNMGWIQRMPWEQIQAALNYIVTMPLYLLLLIVGAILIFIGFFLKD